MVQSELVGSREYFDQLGGVSLRQRQTDLHSAELLFRHEGTDIRLSIAVDPMTDDLLIDMEGGSDTRGIVGTAVGDKLLGY